MQAIIPNDTGYPSEQYKSNRPDVVLDSRDSPLCHALRSHLLLPLRNLPLDLLDHLCQLLLALLPGLRIHSPPDSFAVGTSGRVFALPEVVVELVDAAGAGFAVLALVGLEAALVCVLLLLVRRDGGYRSCRSGGRSLPPPGAAWCR